MTERQGYRGFPTRSDYNDYARRIAADDAVGEPQEQEMRRLQAERFAQLPSLDQIERRHGRAERDRIAAMNLPQHQSVTHDAMPEVGR